MRKLLGMLWIGVGICFLSGCASTGTENSVGSGTRDLLDKEMGLPDAKLGAGLESFSGMEIVEDAGRWQTYQRSSDTLKWKGIPVESIHYNFFKKKLYSIVLEVRGGRETKQMLQTLQRDYGQEDWMRDRAVPNVEVKLENREWSGQAVYAVFKNASDFAGGTLILVEKKTWDLLEKPRLERQEQLRDALYRDPWPEPDVF